MTSPKVTKRRRALREGRLLRNASGHIVKDPTHDPGVVLVDQDPISVHNTPERAAIFAISDANHAWAAHGPLTISLSPDRTGFEYWTLFTRERGQESGPIGPDLDPDDEDTAYAIVKHLRNAGYEVEW